MRCYACERQDTSTCTRCGKSYCPDHGAELCAACLDPVTAAPSSASFRLALLGLFAASVVALWLLVRPPSVPGEDNGVVQQPQRTANFTPGLTPDPGEGTPAPTGSGEPTTTATPGATVTLIPDDLTPAPTTPSTPTPTAAPLEYTVQTGDTWFGIAETFGVDAESLAAFNGYSLADVLPNGVTLVIPQ